MRDEISKQKFYKEYLSFRNKFIQQWNVSEDSPIMEYGDFLRQSDKVINGSNIMESFRSLYKNSSSNDTVINNEAFKAFIDKVYKEENENNN